MWQGTSAPAHLERNGNWRRYDVRWRLMGLRTRRNGWLADPDGLNPLAILNGAGRRSTTVCRRERARMARTRQADVFFEASSLNVLNRSACHRPHQKLRWSWALTPSA